MDPILNPYAPGAGTPPPELAGRDEIRERVRVSIERRRAGRPSKDIVLVGLRGVGKTVLLDQIREDAEADGFHTLSIEAPENRSLPSIIAPQLRALLLKLSNSRKSRVQHLAANGLRALAGFVNALKINYQDIELSLDLDPEPGLADAGVLEDDLQDLLEAAAQVAQADESCIALFVDELQYVDEEEMGALISACHRIAQRRLPFALIGAGLPPVRALMGKAKSYAERMFDFQTIGALSPEDSKRAIVRPANDEGVEIDSAVIESVVAKTQGYPYFLQVWGNHLWNVAEDSPITI